MPAITNFPFGVSSFGIPLIGSSQYLTTGKVFYVDSSRGADGNTRGTDTTTPLATLSFAIGLCVANRGDLILLGPQHAETIGAAAAIAVNKTGVRIIGLGTGTNRPTFTFATSTAATITMTAGSCTFENCIFTLTGIDALVTAISVTGIDCGFERCRFLMSDSTNQAVLAITLAAGANNFFCTDSEFIAVNAGADAAIQCAVAIANVRIQRCRFSGDFAQAAIYNLTNAMVRSTITHNTFYILGTGKAIVLAAAATGIIAWNTGQITANIAAGGSMTAAAALKAENYFQETAGIAASAVVDPAATAIT